MRGKRAWRGPGTPGARTGFSPDPEGRTMSAKTTWRPPQGHADKNHNHRLDAGERADLPESAFALPEQRKLPVTDAAHCRARPVRSDGGNLGRRPGTRLRQPAQGRRALRRRGRGGALAGPREKAPHPQPRARVGILWQAKHRGRFSPNTWENRPLPFRRHHSRTASRCHSTVSGSSPGSGYVEGGEHQCRSVGVGE